MRSPIDAATRCAALERVSHIKQFGEGESQLETLAKAFLSGPVVKDFGDQIPTGQSASQDRRRRMLEATPEGKTILRAQKK